MKPCMHVVEISIFSLNNVTVRPTKISKEKKYLKVYNFQKIFVTKVGHLTNYSSKNGIYFTTDIALMNIGFWSYCIISSPFKNF